MDELHAPLRVSDQPTLGDGFLLWSPPPDPRRWWQRWRDALRVWWRRLWP